jgi:arabinofuranan 3-O-arabinosyltransferase
VLGVAESFNRGWTATIDGTDLAPVVLDGWRQGFVVPDGTAGVVVMDFAPQALFRFALVGGLVVAGILMLLALALAVRGTGRREDLVHDAAETGAAPSGARAWTQVPAGVVLVLVSLPLAVGALIGWLTRDRGDLRVAAACVGALVFAGVIAVSASAVVVPPVVSDVVVALAVGAVCGRVLARP